MYFFGEKVSLVLKAELEKKKKLLTSRFLIFLTVKKQQNRKKYLSPLRKRGKLLSRRN
jgi:hypothetical protein